MSTMSFAPQAGHFEGSQPAATPHFTKPTFLMCPPTFYDVNYVINPWMAGNLHRPNHELALSQWKALHSAITQVADVELIEPQPGTPDMVFVSGAGVVLHGVAILSSFFHKERRGEEQYFRQWLLQQGFLVLDTRRETPFEGEADAMFEADGSRLWAGHGRRSCDCNHRAFEESWGKPVIALKLIDPRFYTLHTCFAALTGGYVMYYPGAFDEESLKKIEAHYSPQKRIEVSEEDAAHFACDALNVGRTVIMHNASPKVASELRQRGFEVVELNLSEFVMGGGAARSLTLRLSDLDVTHAAPAATQFAARSGSRISS
jgi:N-dimethylarginine dimethylaminohydrolase